MSTYRLRRDGVACSDLGGEIVILDLETSVYLSARDTAAVLVEQLVEGATAQALVDALTSRYAVDAAHAAADVEEFLDQLRGRNLLEPVRV